MQNYDKGSYSGWLAAWTVAACHIIIPVGLKNSFTWAEITILLEVK